MAETELKEQAAETEQLAKQKKVELDLDDAPFLQTEEKTPPVLVEEDDLPAAPEEPGESKPDNRKKKLILIAAAAGILLIALLAVWWFFFRTPPPPPPEGPQPEVIVVPSTPPPAQPGDIVLEFAPFIAPVREKDGQEGFLVCKFSAITQNAALNREMEQKMLSLRDAIYYYLRSKDTDYITDARNGAEIKKDLLSIFNDYLSQGKVEDIVFESYLNR